MKLNELKDNQGARKGRMRVGRGIGSGKGKTAGRGQKGAKARSGVSIAGFEGGQMPLHMRLPKRGFNNIFARDYAEVNIGAVQKAIDAGKLDVKATLDHDALKGAGLGRGGKDGVRLLGKGELKAKLAFKVAGVSKGAREAVEKAGGSIELIERKNPAELAAAKKGKVRAARLADQAAKADKPRSSLRATPHLIGLSCQSDKLDCFVSARNDGMAAFIVRKRREFSRMASAAEQFASSLTLANFNKAVELKKRLWFTIGALILFRLLSFVPVPGIDPVAMNALYQTQSGGILDVFNTFSGGALSRFSIVALGVMPYITASIVVQLGGTLYGPWQALRKEGETGRKRLNQYTRYLTVAITLVQGYLAVRGLESQSLRQGISAVVAPGVLFEIAGTVSLVGGTLFLMWIGEQITSRGIGNGVSLIIMAGIVARLPQAVGQLLEGGRTGTLSGVLIVGIVALSVALDPVHLLHGAGPAPRADPISQAPDRARHAAGALAPSDQAQHRRRDPADLRVVAAVDAADHPAMGGAAARRAARATG